MEQRMEILPGVFLTAVQTEKFKTGCCSVNLLRPMAREEAAANALVPSVLLRATAQHPDIRSISAHLDELYGASLGPLVRKKGEVQTTGFFADFIEDRFAGAPVFRQTAEFLGEVLLEPALQNGAFLPDVVSGERLNLENTIAARINDKRTWATSELLRVMCAGEAYGVPRLGELEDVRALDEKNLYAHYRALLTHSQVEIFYMGSHTPDAAAEAFREALRDLPRGEITSCGTVVVPKADAVRKEERALDVTQGKLVLGFRTGCTLTDAEFPALLMMNAIYGGGITSKLFMKVREELSLCYYAMSTLEKFKGVMLVSSGVDCAQRDIAQAEILRQLDAVRAGDISDYEFESARRYLRSSLSTGMDSPGRLDDFYIGQIIAGQPDTMQALSERIARVTKDDVAAAARRVSLDTVFFLKGVQA